jgi:hypothetical protein
MIRRPGRPALDPDDRSVTVTLRLPSKAYDRVMAHAQQERVTIAELIRRRLHALTAAEFRFQK